MAEEVPPDFAPALAPAEGAWQAREALRVTLEAARRARLTELGVAAAAAEASELPVHRREESPEVFRLMQFNLLADALSADGFLCREVLADWPAGHGMVPTASGEAVAFSDLTHEIMSAKGDGAALAALKEKYATPSSRKNAEAIVDWRARELQVRLAVLAAGCPDVLVFQELDHYGSLAAGLAELGYASQLPDRTAAYRPAHLQGFASRNDASRKAFQAHLQETGHAFLPNLGSTAMSIALKRRGLMPGLLQAVKDANLEAQCVDREKGQLRRGLFAGVPGGSEPLLRAAGCEDPASLDDDGVGVFWRRDRLKAEGLSAHFNAKGKGVLEVGLKCLATGRSLALIGAHLSSGGSAGEETTRVEQEVDQPEGLAAILRARREAPGGGATILSMDANAHPQLVAKDGESSVWRSLRAAAGASVWDAYFNPRGDEAAAEGAELQAPVTSNKVRGPLSDQPRKIGDHAYCCIDHVFFDPAALKFKGHVLPPRQFASDDAALQAVQPSLSNPSDHYPVVVDFAWVE